MSVGPVGDTTLDRLSWSVCPVGFTTLACQSCMALPNQSMNKPMYQIDLVQSFFLRR